jgi:excinuclease ABC subunit A
MVAASPESFTGQYLRPLLERASVHPELVEGLPSRPKRGRRKVAASDEDATDRIGERFAL